VKFARTCNEEFVSGILPHINGTRRFAEAQTKTNDT
jgi:hypothetical protein